MPHDISADALIAALEAELDATKNSAAVAKKIGDEPRAARCERRIGEIGEQIKLARAAKRDAKKPAPAPAE